MRKLDKLLIAIILNIILVAMLLVGPVAAGSPSEESKEKAREYFTDLKLTTSDGNEISFYSDVLENRIVLIGGFYTHCATACPMQMKVLSQLQKLMVEKMGGNLGKDIFIVSITLDPERDNLDKLQSYSKRYSDGPGWLFLTGDKKNVDWINYRLGQYAEVVERHTSFYLLGNLKEGKWVRIQPNADAEQLMQLLQEEVRQS